MKLITTLITIFFNDLNLSLRKKRIAKCEKLIEKLKYRLSTEEIYHTMLLKESLEYCNSISKKPDMNV